ncbi:MAG: right-handed parallel beta-helix repeat-containing protein [Verrucomicrobia bacterium]|nr:right-handed parallel beta-helix repeat-containing protein [Verrucomicrobiota bacterium]
MMALENWTFSDNVFRRIQGRRGGGRAAIFLWVRSRQLVVERNLILNCDRGIALGNPGESTANLAGERLVYVADAVVRNNFIAGGPDCGIELWHVERVKVLHNSIWRPERNWSRGIRVGTGTTQTTLVNNLVHGEIRFEGERPRPPTISPAGWTGTSWIRRRATWRSPETPPEPLTKVPSFRK